MTSPLLLQTFFLDGKLLKYINNTVITLEPKVKRPSNVSEFRLIACCNVVYKCISNILCNKMRDILPKIIAENQGEFIHGRFIAYNVMVCQDVVKGYSRKNFRLGFIIKMDMKKAYDSIGLRFMECVKSPQVQLACEWSKPWFLSRKNEGKIR